MKTEADIAAIVGRGYRDFWFSKKRYRVLKGGKASKKSTTAALNFVVRLMQTPESNLLVVRAVMNTHRDSTFAQLRRAQEMLHVAHLWENTVSPLEMTFLPTGQKILFRGFDDVLKLASTTVSKGYLCWVWVEEAFEIEREEDFDKLDMSVPRGTVPDGLFKQTTLTFNPWSATHWLKKRFFDRPDGMTDTFSTNYTVNEFLDETDRAVFERMKHENPRRYAVAGLGEWGISEGLVYENWSTETFDVFSLGREDGTAWQYRNFFGLDYGYSQDPTAFIAMAVNPVQKTVHIFDEHYQTKMLNCDIAAMLRQKGYAKERIRADAAEPKSNDDLRRQGISHLLPSVKGRDSILNGIAAVQEYRITVHPRCVHTIQELSSYCYAKEESRRGMPEDKNNHLMDAMRYAFYDVRFFRPTASEKERQNAPAAVLPEDFKGSWTG